MGKFKNRSLSKSDGFLPPYGPDSSGTIYLKPSLTARSAIYL